MAMRAAPRDAERLKRRKSALSLADRWFCFRGVLSAQRARLAAAIAAAGGQIFPLPSASSSSKPAVVYVVTDYWVDTLLTPPARQDAAGGAAFVAVTEFWLSEMVRTQEWIDVDAHVFFTPPPRLRGALLRKECFISYPEAHNERQGEAKGGGAGGDNATAPQTLLMNLPCSPDYKFKNQVPFWPYFVAYLSLPMRNTRELAMVLKCITGTEARRPMNSLEIAINSLLSADQRNAFFKKLLPEMARLVLSIPAMFAERPEVLGPFFDASAESQTRSTLLEKSVTFTKREALALVSACFFCVFPSQSRLVTRQRDGQQDSEEQYTEGDDDDEVDFPFFTMRPMYFAPSNGGGADLKAQKIRCVLEYFLRVVPLAISDNNADRDRLDNEVITFTRVAVALSPATKKPFAMTPSDLLDVFSRTNSSSAAATPLPMRGVRCESEHLIEDLDDHLQIDFANKFAGGGVFNSGCVQEEIRFLLSPELFIACLVFAKLEPNESFVIHGTERYCLYGGYGSSFIYKDAYEDTTGFDATADGKRRRKCVIVGIDAVDYGSSAVGRQYTRVHIWRDLVKAFVGFAYPSRECAAWPVATGNWGCGVFRGDAELKFLIQWLAASLAGRELVYVLFERDHELHESILELLQVFESVKEESEAQRVPLLVAQFLLALDESLTRRLNGLRSAGKRATRPSVLALARDFLDMQLQGLKRLKLSSPSDSRSPPQQQQQQQSAEEIATRDDSASSKKERKSPEKIAKAAGEPPTKQQQELGKKQHAAPANPVSTPTKSPADGKAMQQKSIHEFFAKK